jgi:hypothetical protein
MRRMAMAGLPLGRLASHCAPAHGSDPTARTIQASDSTARHPGGAPYRPPHARGRLARTFIVLSREGPSAA